MGNCADFNEQEKYKSENQTENFYREVLFSSRLREYTLAGLIDEFRRVPKVKTEGTQQELTYTESDYESVCEQYFIDEYSDFVKCHRNMFPEFDALFTENKKKKPEFNFTVFGFSFVNDSNKWPFVKNLLNSADLELNYANFTNFLKHYLSEILIDVPLRINTVVQDYKEKVLIGEFLINDDFKKSSNELFSVYNEENIQIFIDEINKHIRDIIGVNEHAKELKASALNVNILEKLAVYYPYLFQTLDLRKNFYDKFNYKKIEMND